MSIAKHEQLSQGTTGLEHSTAIEACTAFGRPFVKKGSHYAIGPLSVLSVFL